MMFHWVFRSKRLQVSKQGTKWRTVRDRHYRTWRRKGKHTTIEFGPLTIIWKHR